LILLDTHALLWLLQTDGGRLTRAAYAAIGAEMAGGLVSVSAISAWEIALLVAKGRLALGTDLSAWLTKVMAHPSIRFVSVSPEIAIGAVNLPGSFHADPADRIIVATARLLGLTLVTADPKILAYPHVLSLPA